MSNLKVGDIRKWNEEAVDHELLFIITAIGKSTILYVDANDPDGREYDEGIENMLKISTPYQEPVPVKRIVGHVTDAGRICLGLEGSEYCKENDYEEETHRRIELSPEMFWGAK